MATFHGANFPPRVFQEIMFVVVKINIVVVVWNVETARSNATREAKTGK